MGVVDATLELNFYLIYEVLKWHLNYIIHHSLAFLIWFRRGPRPQDPLGFAPVMLTYVICRKCLAIVYFFNTKRLSV